MVQAEADAVPQEVEVLHAVAEVRLAVEASVGAVALVVVVEAAEGSAVVAAEVRQEDEDEDTRSGQGNDYALAQAFWR